MKSLAHLETCLAQPKMHQQQLVCICREGPQPSQQALQGCLQA